MWTKTLIKHKLKLSTRSFNKFIQEQAKASLNNKIIIESLLEF